MPILEFRFPSRCCHATPLGYQVNEGTVEWPPSPWWILRAMVATWKRTLPGLAETDVKAVLQALATPPEFVLPPASTGHTRHYMPILEGSKITKTKVFDTFVAVPREATLLAHWPRASIDGAQREPLARILGNMNTLGRSESWCEATLLDEEGTRARGEDVTGGSREIAEDKTSGSSKCARTDSRGGGCEKGFSHQRGLERQRLVSAPLSGSDPSDDAEIVRLLCPNPESAFADDHVVTVTARAERRGKNKRTVEQRSMLYDPAWNICMETLQLHKECWSAPRGSRWVQYARPRDCFKIERAARRPTRSRRERCVQVVRYALDSTVLPLATETLPVAEAARRALMSIHGRLTERDNVRGRSTVFSGKEEHGLPLTGHAHTYYLPTDEDGDGRLDHLTIFARAGFGDAERRALDVLGERELHTRRKGEEHHPLRLLLLGLGTLDEYFPGPLRPSQVWVSATPYLVTRHAKTRGRDRIDTASPQARAEFLMADLREQLCAVLGVAAGDADAVKIAPEWDGHGVFRLSGCDNRRDLRPIQFKRFRSKPGDDGGRRLAGAFRITFRAPVRGPVCLGHSSHFGMGLFTPVDNAEATASPVRHEETRGK